MNEQKKYNGELIDSRKKNNNMKENIIYGDGSTLKERDKKRNSDKKNLLTE